VSAAVWLCVWPLSWGAAAAESSWRPGLRSVTSAAELAAATYPHKPLSSGPPPPTHPNTTHPTHTPQPHPGAPSTPRTPTSAAPRRAPTSTSRASRRPTPSTPRCPRWCRRAWTRWRRSRGASTACLITWGTRRWVRGGVARVCC